MEILIIYNEISKNIKIKDNSSIGDVQEKILTTFSLLIYNIENCHIYLENDESKKLFIMGDENCPFHTRLEDFLKENNYTRVEKIIIYDRRRDENGNVIKENKIIDNYNKWYQLKEDEEFIQTFRTTNAGISVNPFLSMFNNILQSSMQNYMHNNGFADNNNQAESKVDEEGDDDGDENEDDCDEKDDDDGDEKENGDEKDDGDEKEENDDDNIPELIPNDFGNIVNILDSYINNISQNMENEDYIRNVSLTTENPVLYNYFLNSYNRSNPNLQRNNIFQNINFTIDPPTVLENVVDQEENDSDYITFNIPISFYTNNLPVQEDVIVALTEDDFNKLNIFDYDGENDNECLICTECFIKEESVCKLECNHHFHTSCLKPWLCENSNKCPVCRIEVTKGTPKIN
jgi:hypothetical protein